MAGPVEKGNGKWMVIGAGTIVFVIIVLGIFAVILLQPGAPEAPPPVEEEPEEEVPPPPVEEPEEEIPEENITEVCDDNCLYEKALDEKDIKYCDWMLNETKQMECYFAIANDSFDACLKVTDEEVFYDCVVSEADRTGNISVCDNLYEEKAVECKKEFEPCYFYNDTELKICLALKNDDSGYCGNDDDCLLNYSIERDDKSVCDDITSEAIGTACISVHEGRDKCTKLFSLTEKEYCWQLYAILSDNKLICTQIASESQYALDCFSHFAVKTNDLSFCRSDNLELDLLWKCYTNYALGTGNMSGCDEINPLATTNVFNCYFEYGKKYGDPRACDKMYEEGFATTCYVGVILNSTNLNPDYCGEVRVEEWRNRCYTETAKIYDDVTICHNIDSTGERNACIETYEEYVESKSE